MADRGYLADSSEHAAAALRIQQLKMQLRTILNTILDLFLPAAKEPAKDRRDVTGPPE